MDANRRTDQHHESDNPKTAPNPQSNMVKDPEDWVTGGEPMTGAQASYLKTLSERAHDENAYDGDLTKAEASERIDALKEKTGLKDPNSNR